MMARLERDIHDAFRDLFEAKKFRKTFEHYDDQHFGNEVLMYASPELALKFVRDRGEILLDVGPPDGTSWYMAPRLYEYLRIASNAYGPADSALLRRHAHLLSENYDRISDLFIPERLAATETELRKFWKLNAEEMFPSDGVGEYGPH
ncbi:MAG: hypothetical protein JO088_02835 [Acidobacteria bacterium]|nr:hypothetical protein [Acidobacteriota bacterium]MBV9067891.1 hypothetical protein [Acidobacteriota bacterium]